MEHLHTQTHTHTLAQTQKKDTLKNGKKISFWSRLIMFFRFKIFDKIFLYNLLFEEAIIATKRKRKKPFLDIFLLYEKCGKSTLNFIICYFLYLMMTRRNVKKTVLFVSDVSKSNLLCLLFFSSVQKCHIFTRWNDDSSIGYIISCFISHAGQQTSLIWFRFWKTSWQTRWEKEPPRPRRSPPSRWSRPSCGWTRGWRWAGRPEVPSSTSHPVSSCAADPRRRWWERARPGRPGKIGDIPDLELRRCGTSPWRTCEKRLGREGRNRGQRPVFLASHSTFWFQIRDGRNLASTFHKFNVINAEPYICDYINPWLTKMLF